jgi:hypothetical protein
MDETKRQYHGRESALQMIQSIAQRVNFRSEERTIKLLKSYLTETAPCNNQWELHSEIENFKAEYGVYSRISNMDCAVMYKSALKHMLSLLNQKPELNEPLVVKMAICEAQYPGDMQRYMEELENCASALALMDKPTVTVKRVQFRQRGEDRSDAHRHVNPVVKGDMLCMNKREGKPCRDGLKCPFSHDGASGTICTDAQYLETGICAQFNTNCPNKHPWNETKHGPKSELMEKLKSSTKKAYLHSVNMVGQVGAQTNNTQAEPDRQPLFPSCYSAEDYTNSKIGRAHV